MEQIRNNPGGDRGEQRTGQSADGSLRNGGERGHLPCTEHVIGTERLRHEPCRRAAESEVQQAEVANDGPHQCEQPEPAVAERPGQDGDADEADEKRHPLAEDVEERIARKAVGAHHSRM